MRRQALDIVLGKISQRSSVAMTCNTRTLTAKWRLGVRQFQRAMHLSIVSTSRTSRLWADGSGSPIDRGNGWRRLAQAGLRFRVCKSYVAK